MTENVKPPQNGRVLTGRELRAAAHRGLPVGYIEGFFNPSEPGFAGVVVMEKAKYGYYIGPSDIEPEAFGDTEPVSYETDVGYVRVTAVEGIDYTGT